MGHMAHVVLLTSSPQVPARGPLGLWAYYRVGRLIMQDRVRQAREQGEESPGKRKPFWLITGVAATHCGSGCALGDLRAEWLIGRPRAAEDLAGVLVRDAAGHARGLSHQLSRQLVACAPWD
jgi:hypothetical protein